MVIAEQVRQAKIFAERAGQEMYQRVGESDACGFAWVEVSVDRANSPQAKELLAAGFRKDYKPKTLTMWDPAGLPTQSVSVKEAGAEAMAEYLRSLGLSAYAGSRLD